MRRTLLLLVVLTGALAAPVRPAGARTWTVDAFGTGDAPSISAAMDSASSGDTVLVGPGYYKDFIEMADGVTLRSEEGPETTVVSGFWTIVRFSKLVSGTLEGFTLTGVPYSPVWEQGVVECQGAAQVRIRNNLITNSGRSGIYGVACLGVEVSGNTIADMTGEGAFMGIYFEDSGPLTLRNNLCAGYAFGIGIRDSYLASLDCNDAWDNGQDFWPASPGNPWPWGTNLSVDPLFCNRPAFDYRLDCCSPCLVGPCGRIGALGAGCGSSRTAPATWSAVKALMR